MATETEREAVRSCALAVGGMDCGSCAEHVERALRALGGVRAVRADIVAERVVVEYDAGHVDPAEMAGAVRRLGYNAREEAGRPADEAEGWWARHGRLALAVTAGLLWAGSVAAQRLAGSPELAGAFAFAAVVVGGRYVVPRGLRAAAGGALDMNFLMTVAAAGALAIGEWSEAAAVMFLFSVAQWLEVRSMDRARRAIRGLMALSPAEATVLRDGREARVAVEAVPLGATVLVRPGERIPVDGTVLAGESEVDEAPITGESLPAARGPGAEVFAGTLNGGGALELRVGRPAEDTTLARIVRAVEEAQASRAPTQAFVDRFARVYTPIVVAGAAAIAVLPPLAGVGLWGDWIYRALVLLVVACPCALVISTPVTIASALAAAARRGILIKGGLHLEMAGRARVVALDKTGTLTVGRPEVTAVEACEDFEPRLVLQLAAAAELRSGHPLGGAVLRQAGAEGIDVPEPEETTALVGRGVRARIGDRVVFVGSERLFHEEGTHPGATACLATAADKLRHHELEGRTAVLVGVDEGDGLHAAGVIAFADRARPAAAGMIAALRRAGIRRIAMLTGDNPRTADAIAAGLASAGGRLDDVAAALLPEDKVAAVHELRARHGTVLLVGDGVNDAPALAAADVGVAMGTAGTDVALETADIALMADDLSRLPVAIRIARKAEGIIRVNIAFALATKAVFVVLAAAGLATLWMAVLADMGASLLVIGNGLRALRVREDDGSRE
jgi:Zn2+/Cd2+-exporting ATPase